MFCASIVKFGTDLQNLRSTAILGLDRRSPRIVADWFEATEITSHNRLRRIDLKSQPFKKATEKTDRKEGKYGG
jgi:hypothetical protein